MLVSQASVQYLESSCGNFEIDSMANREPVQVGQNWRDVARPRLLCNNLSEGEGKIYRACVQSMLTYGMKHGQWMMMMMTMRVWGKKINILTITIKKHGNPQYPIKESWLDVDELYIFFFIISVGRQSVDVPSFFSRSTASSIHVYIRNRRTSENRFFSFNSTDVRHTLLYFHFQKLTFCSRLWNCRRRE